MLETYPIYRKGYCHIYKVISDREAIQVLFSDSERYGISIVQRDLAFNDGEEESTEAEFKKYANRITDILIELDLWL